MKIELRTVQEYKDALRNLVELVNDPHPGLLTWMGAYNDAVRELQEIMDEGIDW